MLYISVWASSWNNMLASVDCIHRILKNRAHIIQLEQFSIVCAICTGDRSKWSNKAMKCGLQSRFHWTLLEDQTRFVGLYMATEVLLMPYRVYIYQCKVTPQHYKYRDTRSGLRWQTQLMWNLKCDIPEYSSNLNVLFDYH